MYVCAVKTGAWKHSQKTVDGKLMFGELTFSPSAGNLVYEPYNDEIQKKYGALFKLPPHDKNGFAIRNK